MKSRAREPEVHAWWERLPGERYWLDVTDRDGRDELLAAPRGDGGAAASWTHRLITHVRGGDVVFHYDASQQAIVAVSLPHGRVEKRALWWPQPAEIPDEPATRRQLPSWGIALRQSTELGTAVPLHEIAGAQWSLFPALRALEDEVGDPLYYPFEMGSQTATRPLTGYIFKLPALIVSGIPELARAASRVERQVAAHAEAPSPRPVPAARPYAESR